MRKPLNKYAKLLKTREVAEILGYARITITHWAEKGKIKFIKVGGTYRYFKKDVISFMKEDKHGSYLSYLQQRTRSR